MKLIIGRIPNRFRTSSSLWWVGVASALVIALIGMVSIAHGAVTVVYFRAVPGNSQVMLEWETATEIQNAGFYINRSLSENGPFVRISPFINGLGDDLTGWQYDYTDRNLTNGNQYWYLLEAVDLNNVSEFFQPPVLGLPSAASTPTATATRTSTPTSTTTQVGAAGFTRTPTATATNAYPVPGTATNTVSFAYPAPATATPTSAAYPGVATATLPPTLAAQATNITTTSSANIPQAAFQANQAGTPSIEGNTGSTATLLPLPEVAMVFPSPVAGEQSLAKAVGQDGSPDVFGANQMGFFGFIAFIWVALGAWFFYSLRRVQS